MANETIVILQDGEVTLDYFNAVKARFAGPSSYMVVHRAAQSPPRPAEINAERTSTFSPRRMRRYYVLVDGAHLREIVRMAIVMSKAGVQAEFFRRDATGSFESLALT